MPPRRNRPSRSPLPARSPTRASTSPAESTPTHRTRQPGCEGGSPEEEEIRSVFHTNWHFECTPECPAAGGELDADNTAHPVAADPTGLQPNTTYTVVLRTSNTAGEEGRRRDRGGSQSHSHRRDGAERPDRPAAPDRRQRPPARFREPPQHCGHRLPLRVRARPLPTARACPALEETLGLFTTQTLTVAATAGSSRLSLRGPGQGRPRPSPGCR